jgi:orotidine-5'-phosphate decarboxylase
MTDAKDKLIVALDLPAYEAARDLVNQLGDTVTFRPRQASPG